MFIISFTMVFFILSKVDDECLEAVGRWRETRKKNPETNSGSTVKVNQTLAEIYFPRKEKSLEVEEESKRSRLRLHQTHFSKSYLVFYDNSHWQLDFSSSRVSLVSRLVWIGHVFSWVLPLVSEQPWVPGIHPSNVLPSESSVWEPVNPSNIWLKRQFLWFIMWVLSCDQLTYQRKEKLFLIQ